MCGVCVFYVVFHYVFFCDFCGLCAWGFLACFRCGLSCVCLVRIVCVFVRNICMYEGKFVCVFIFFYVNVVLLYVCLRCVYMCLVCARFCV